MRGAEIFVKALIDEGVEHLFGYPGATIIHTMDVLYDTKEIDVVLTRHEQGAVHAADGYARSSGKVGVCIATSGPGATNTITGLATAYMDSIPMVCFTGQVPTSLIGNDAFQECDTVGISRSITKHNYMVSDVKDLQRIIKEAFYIASTGRPGPVLIDIPKDVTTNDCDYDPNFKVDLAGYSPDMSIDKKQVKLAMELIESSERPIIYAGGGVVIADASKELLEFVNKTGIPITMTLMGLGGFPTAHELSLDMLGMHGTIYANRSITDSDLIISIGSRFDDRVTGDLSKFAPHAKIVHVDIDPTSIAKNVEVDVEVIADAKVALVEMNKIAKKLAIKPWVDKVLKMKADYPLIYKKEPGIIKPQEVIEKLSELTGGDAIICTEVGQHQMWAAQFYRFTNPRTFVTSGGLGTMGYGFPAAIGAQYAHPDKLVFDIAGDGSIQMNIQELATAVINKKNVKIIILNNGYLGMVRQWQELFFDRRYASTVLTENENELHTEVVSNYVPDFVKLAEAYGAYGRRITKPEEIEESLKDIIGRDNVCVLEVMIAPEENVMPMVPANAGLNQMIGGLA